MKIRMKKGMNLMRKRLNNKNRNNYIINKLIQLIM